MIPGALLRSGRHSWATGHRQVLVQALHSYENIYSFYLERPAAGVQEFTCAWLVAMSERSSGLNATSSCLNAEGAPGIVPALRASGNGEVQTPALTDRASSNCRSFGPVSIMNRYQMPNTLRILVCLLLY